MRLADSRNVSGIVRRTLGYVDERLVQHGERVAYTVLKMLQYAGGYTDRQIRDYCFLAMIHDIGAYKTEEIDNMIHFETEHIWNHSVYGYLFVKYLSFSPELASAILFHHLNWDRLKEQKDENQVLAQMINLADRMDIIWENRGKLDEKKFLEPFREKKFSSDMIELFLSAEKKYHIYDRKQSGIYLEELLSVLGKVSMTDEEIDKTLSMLVSAIDFRSHYTVIHTITTTSISRAIGSLMGVGEANLFCIQYGAMLHDLGKVGVPVEILEYPGKLDEKSMGIMKEHVNITENILGGEIDTVITNIALRHHEKLDGSGYPKGVKDTDLTLNEKIVAVSDIISALCGRRSYKEAYDKDCTIGIIQKQAEAGLISRDVVDTAVRNFDEIMEFTKEQAKPYLQLYYTIGEEYNRLMEQIDGHVSRQ